VQYGDACDREGRPRSSAASFGPSPWLQTAVVLGKTFLRDDGIAALAVGYPAAGRLPGHPHVREVTQPLRRPVAVEREHRIRGLALLVGERVYIAPARSRSQRVSFAAKASTSTVRLSN